VKMPGETPEKTIDQSTPIEKSENLSSNEQTETSLVTLNVDVETSTLKDNIKNDKENSDISTNNTNTINPDVPTSNRSTTNNPNIPTDNPENQKENLALKQQLETLNKIKILLEGYKSLKK